MKREMLFVLAEGRESLGGQKGPGEQEVPTRTNPLGSKEGHGFSGGRKSLKRRYKADEVL